jgi:23S rRNA (guanine745-N1)-methyltransferase
VLVCSVRKCQLPLLRERGRLVCSRGHSFDIARSGYINLLQPQDRRSKEPGDAPEAVAARRRLHDRGVTEPLRRAIAEMAGVSANDVILDAGCGDGFYLGSLPGAGHGIDISIPAVEAAARRYPGCEWVVANADRLVPYADGSFSIAMSITGRMNARELRRVLRDDGRDGGRLLVAIPSPEDLVELRGAGRDRVGRTVETFAGDFVLAEQRRATTSADLDAAAVQDVLHSIYRPMQPRPATAMRVTFSLDLLLFRVKQPDRA